MLTLRPLKNLRRVYCAGPLFNKAERAEMQEIARHLNAHGFDTFVPHADGMQFAQVLKHMISLGHDPHQAGLWGHDAIFALDTYQTIVDCGSMVFDMNGRVPDEGGVAEMSMAWMLGKPLVLYKDDFRSLIAGRDNPLLVGQTRFNTVTEIEHIAPALSEHVSRLESNANWEMPCPPHMEPILRSGEELWTSIQSLGKNPDAGRVAELVLQLFGPGKASARI